VSNTRTYFGSEITPGTYAGLGARATPSAPSPLAPARTTTFLVHSFVPRAAPRAVRAVRAVFPRRPASPVVVVVVVVVRPRIVVAHAFVPRIV
jgi:hypothetical protein